MDDDILDKIVVPDVKSTKGDVFKKKSEEHSEERKEVEDKPKKVFHEKKEIFKKREFKKQVVTIKTPGLIERGIYIVIILILFYFVFFQNVNINLDVSKIFGGNEIHPLVIKSIENDSNNGTEEIIDGIIEEPKLSGEITFTVDKVKTEKFDTGISKIKGFTFTIDNQKEDFDAKIVYYAYDSSTPKIWITKPRGDSFYISSIEVLTKTIDTSVVFSTTSTKTLRVELYDGDNLISNVTKEITIS